MEYEILDFYHIFNVAYILSRFFTYIDIKAYQFYLKYVILMKLCQIIYLEGYMYLIIFKE